MPIRDRFELKRVKNLVIPPAWKKVWISPLANSHLQCTGKDEKNRKQYLYHPDWAEYRQSEKFDRLREFGEQLSGIRSAYKKGLCESKWNKAKVISLIVCLLDKHYFRIGNQQYASDNKTYGVTTLRRKHIQQDSDKLSLVYKAKSGKLRKVRLEDKKVTKLLKEVSELPGYEIFRFKESSGSYSSIDSSDVNTYLKEITQEDFTAKDFRTWGASKLALEEYEGSLMDIKNNKRLKFESALIKRVAKEIGNTVSVCRQYYIHPTVLSLLEEHHPKPLADLSNDDSKKMNRHLSNYEHMLLNLLKS